MWVDDNPDQARYPFDPWHDELIRMGFSWRYGLPNEYREYRKVLRFYWKPKAPYTVPEETVIMKRRVGFE